MDILSYVGKNERIIDLSIQIDQGIYLFGVKNVLKNRKEFAFKDKKIGELFTELKLEFEKSHLSMVKDFSDIDIYEKIVSPIIEKYMKKNSHYHH